MSESIIQAAVRSFVLLSLGLLIWPLLPVQQPIWRRRLVLWFLGALLLLPFLPITIISPLPNLVASLPMIPEETFIPWWSLIWVVGSALGLLRLAWQVLLLRGVLRKARDLGRLDFADCPLQLKETSAVSSPCVTGWMKATLLVPPGSAEWNQPRWQCVLWHERQHAMQHDVAAIWLVRLATALYWWNPLVHLAARQFHIECEAACDAAVLKSGATPKEYVETLLSFSQVAGMPAISITGKSSLRKRIERFLTRQDENKSSNWRLACGITAAALVAGFSLLCGIKFAVPEKSAMEEEVEIRLSANPFPSSDAEPTGEPLTGQP